MSQSALGAVCGEGTRPHLIRFSNTSFPCISPTAHGQPLPALPTPARLAPVSIPPCPDSDDDSSVARAPSPTPPKSTRHDPATHTTCPCPRGPRTAHACLSKHALYRFRCRRRRSVVVSRAAGDPPPSARVRESNHHTTAAGLYEGRATAHPHPRLHQFARAASAAPSL